MVRVPIAGAVVVDEPVDVCTPDEVAEEETWEVVVVESGVELTGGLGVVEALKSQPHRLVDESHTHLPGTQKLETPKFAWQ